MTQQTIKPRRSAIKLIAISLSIYIIWVAATYFLEGRIQLFQNVDPIGRMVYTVVANIAVGTVLSAIVLRYLLKAELVKPEQLGLDKSRIKTAVIIALAGVGGLALFILQNPRTTEPIVVFNAFMQVLPVSIAEVVVCWALVGSSFESVVKNGKDNNGRRISSSVIVGAVVASALFGVYHYAHSPPFNQPSMVLFLMLPSIATAVTYFLGRDIYAAVIVQNFMGIIGVIAGLPNLEVYRQPMIPIYALSVVSIVALIVSVRVTTKRSHR